MPAMLPDISRLPAVKIDRFKVKAEPLFEDAVDFDTFSRSDFRVVKVEACEAASKSRKLLKFIRNDGTDRKRTILSGIHEHCEPEALVWKDLHCHCKPAAEEDDSIPATAKPLDFGVINEGKANNGGGLRMKSIARAELFAAAALLFAAFAFPAYGEEGGLSEAEFAEACEAYHADESRYFFPPLHDPEREAERLNYEYHYRTVLMLPDGSFADNPYDPKRVQCLNEGEIWMDMEDGYEVSYEYLLRDTEHAQSEETVVEGKTITPYYRAVPLDEAVYGTERTYRYVPNNPAEVPIIPDFPQNYDWSIHKEKTLQVSARVTVRSVKDGREASFESNIGNITNLYKEEPDCYTMGPIDRYAYTIEKGDSLYKIAKKFYGNGADWIYIRKRNEEKLPDEDKIYPGTLLVIPDAEAYR